MFRYTLFILLAFLAGTATAQKKDIAQAKTFLKTNKELDKAESLVRKVIAMPGQEKEISHYVLLADIARRQYENFNEQVYLKQLKDTTSLFRSLCKMYYTYETLDSVDAMPDKKNEINPKYRKRNSEFLAKYRANLFNGGLYYARNRKHAECFECMECYLQCETSPLFSAQNYAVNDTARYAAAYWALNSARRMKDHTRMMQYADLAQQYKPRATRTLAMLYESCMENSDTISAIAYLRKGFDEHPEYPFFFPRLVDFYSSRDNIQIVKQFVDRANEIEPGNQFYRLARNTVQLNMGEYDECIELGDSLIHLNDKMADAYLNVGSSYFNKALAIEKLNKPLKQRRKEAGQMYEKARPYLERYRQLRQRKSDVWAPMLYTIYLNLNMGEEFDEIDKLLIKSKK